MARDPRNDYYGQLRGEGSANQGGNGGIEASNRFLWIRVLMPPRSYIRSPPLLGAFTMMGAIWLLILVELLFLSQAASHFFCSSRFPLRIRRTRHRRLSFSPPLARGRPLLDNCQTLHNIGSYPISPNLRNRRPIIVPGRRNGWLP